ncbi:MAG: outer membrane protein assembly factor BamA [Acidobacteria bacterium RIFCSPLOWO2_02_FULL_68_18]|nr:MAG: outer membrane protein assembly factor BamA [Acidobacteria bacterium RIFCSPLOWO2_02_FULL_68_18]OFW49954.1 MAG: outer membrane protein assembly factor BamA [Acidobacteria bacterium RIFCSPLOWO2_12_FULL_68_19]
MRIFDPRVLLLTALVGAAASPGWAQPVQAPGGRPTICGVPVGPPANLPPADSGPVVYVLAPCFSAQGNVSTVEPQTYLFYIHLRPSQPSQNIWVRYDDQAEQTMLEDFKRLWATNFLTDLSIDVTDYVFSNGVVGKLVAYHIEERERVKIVNYEGTKQIDRAKIDEQLRMRGIEMRLDSFLDRGVIRRIEGVLREMMAEKGFTNAEVKHGVSAVAGGPKLVNVTFNISEGPKLKIRDIEFIGNTARSDRSLRKKMKENKEPNPFFGWITRGGTYKEDKYEADADLVQAYYRQEGYVRAQIGQPEVRVLQNSGDGKTRWIQLRIPVTEGPRYRVGEFGIEGNTVVKGEALRPLFAVQKGEWYNEKKVRDGLIKARELYGAGGYMEFTGFPDLKPSDEPEENVPAALAAPPPPGPPTVDVTMRLQEGQQYFVNRITFVGNSSTRDNVIRREMRLVEGAVFNTEALKYSVRRLNQLGYFEQINEQDQNAIKTEKTPGRDGNVDVTLTLKEQNRNQLTFGAGVSQYEGIFGQLAFQTANFLGRGESLTMSLMAGDRMQNYQLGFTEPFLFDRNITAGFDVYKRALQFIGYYTQKSTGGNLMMGFPVADFSRMFVSYAYEAVRMTDLNEAFLDPSCIFSEAGCSTVSLTDLSTISPDALESIRRNPFVFDSLLLGAGGRRTVSKIIPSFVHNTVDNPIFPNTGQRLTLSIDLAMLGGNTQYYKPRVEAVRLWRHTSRTSVGVRGQFEFIAPIRNTRTLPIFEKLFLGGEYSVRGYDIRSIGPSDPYTGLVLGGNKSLLLNGEYLFSIVSQVRLIFFYDAGQVADDRDSFAFDKFRTSTGAEVRFFMPVLNVPFRLIFSANPQREGVLDNSLRPAKSFTFRFAVGSTF